MTQFLTILGFIALYVMARRMASVKRDNQFGFYVPKKKSIWEKLFGK